MLKIVQKGADKIANKLKEEADTLGITVEELNILNERFKVRKSEMLFFDFVNEEGIVSCLASTLSLLPNERAREILVDRSFMSPDLFMKINAHIDFNVFSKTKTTLENYIIKG